LLLPTNYSWLGGINAAVDNLQKEIIIDLTVGKKQLDESFLRMFGSAIELIIKRMFGLNNLNFKVKGSRSNIKKFVNTLSKESSHLRALKDYGLDNPSTLRTRAALAKAVSGFESSTGITWPFK